MKKIMFLFVLPILFFACKSDNKKCLSDYLGEGVIAYYPFTDGNVADASSNNNDLTIVQNVTPKADRNGNTSCAYEFDSRQDPSFLSTPNTTFLNDLEHFSIVLWYLPLDTGEVTNNQILISRGEDVKCPPRKGEWAISIFETWVIFGHDNLIWRPFSVWDGDFRAYLHEIYGTWHHIAAVKDGDEMLLYMDGELAETVMGVKPCSSGLPVDIGDLFIGQGLRGRLDDIIIYNRAIGQAEVKTLYGLSPC